jgi:hypothetical protein
MTVKEMGPAVATRGGPFLTRRPIPSKLPGRMQSPQDQHQAARENLQRLNADPRFQAARVEGIRRRHADPVFQAKHATVARERLTRLNADPTFKAAQAERMRQLNADPEFQAARLKGLRQAKTAST